MLQTRQPVVGNPAAAETATAAPEAVPAAAETAMPDVAGALGETSEEEKQKARAKKFGITAPAKVSTQHIDLQDEICH